MLFDPGPEEPDDPFDIDGPSVDIPSAEDAPPELVRAFWRLVVVFNAAVFALAVGLLLIGFRGDWRRGGALIVIGIVATVYGYRRYQAVRAQ